MTTPNLTTCDTNPQLDPYQRDTGGETWTKFFVDLRDGEYGIEQAYNDNSTPADEWNGVVQATGLSTRPDQDAARAYLTDPETVDLVQRVIDGGSVEWDGSNHVGGLDDDAQAAWDELIAGLEALPENDWSVQSVSDWLDGVDLEIDSETTNAVIEARAAELEALTLDEHTILTGDVIDHLYEAREEAIDEAYITTEQAGRLVEMDPSHLRRMVRDGKLSGRKLGRDWLIRPGDLAGVRRIKSGRPRSS